MEIKGTIKKISDDIRKKPRPILVEALTFRIRGHEEASGIKYVPKELIERWKKKDPVKLFEKYLADKKILTEDFVKVTETKIKKNVLSNIDLCLNKKEILHQ